MSLVFVFIIIKKTNPFGNIVISTFVEDFGIHNIFQFDLIKDNLKGIENTYSDGN